MIHKIILNFRKRRNSAKWKHKDGGRVHKPFGYRNILDNWQPIK